jgi:hypothetical protein
LSGFSSYIQALLFFFGNVAWAQMAVQSRKNGVWVAATSGLWIQRSASTICGLERAVNFWNSPIFSSKLHLEYSGDDRLLLDL